MSIAKFNDFVNYQNDPGRFVNFKDGKTEVNIEKYNDSDGNGVYLTIDNGSMDSGSLYFSLENFREFIKRCQWVIEND